MNKTLLKHANDIDFEKLAKTIYGKALDDNMRSSLKTILSGKVEAPVFEKSIQMATFRILAEEKQTKKAVKVIPMINKHDKGRA